LFLVVGVALTVPLYAFGVRRLLGLRLSPLQALIGGVAEWFGPGLCPAQTAFYPAIVRRRV
jgi:hypothetical protein